jgi:hypothetical protein
MAGYRGGSGGGGGGGGAPTDAQYLTLAANGGLSDERVLTAGTGISLTDGGAGGALTVAATGGGGAPTDAQYLTLAANGGLSDERVLTAGTGISLTDGGAGGALTVANTIAAGAPTAAQYLTLAADGGLTNERVLTAGTGISLTDGGAGGALTVAATGGGGGGGKILQVVHVPYTTLTTTNSLTYVDLMAGAITPTDATSTILIVVNLCISITSGGTGIFRVYDGAAAVSGGVKNAAHANQESGNIYLMSSVSTPHGYAPMYGFSTTIKDSPATTSAVTYTVQFKCSASVDPITVNRNTRDGNSLVDSPGISTLTIYEIGA